LRSLSEGPLAFWLLFGLAMAKLLWASNAILCCDYWYMIARSHLLDAFRVRLVYNIGAGASQERLPLLDDLRWTSA